ncbi:MAG: DUF2934 domain-containing protein [Burkholderiaceae bacterium]|jgi:hypothetical protein|nr:DUF2934 domain-containing protein [Burkholderiaceae bacterium]
MPATGSRVSSRRPKTASARARTGERRATSRAKRPRPDAPNTGEPEPTSRHAREDDPTQEDRIRYRAYQLYECNGRIEGHALDDWLAAEAEIIAGDTVGTAPLPYAADAP